MKAQLQHPVKKNHKKNKIKKEFSTKNGELNTFLSKQIIRHYALQGIVSVLKITNWKDM